MNFELITKFIPYVFPGICCTVFLTAFILSDRTFPKATLNSFMLSVIFAFLLVVGDAIDYYLEFEKMDIYLRLIVGSINYIFRIGSVGCIVRISQRKIRRHVIIIDCFLGINAVASIMNIWTGWFFIINPDQTWSFGPLMFFPYTIIGIFISFFIFSVVKYFRTNKGESIIVIAICFICVMANVLEIVLSIKIILAQAFSISAVLYYLCLTTELYKRDALTEVFNRRTFYLDVQKRKNRSFVVIMMDLNDLKKFNDLEGHKAGDLALITSVQCMQKVFIKYGYIYRLGGDEFAVIIRQKHMNKTSALLEDFSKVIGATKYTMAYGFERYDPGINFDTVLEIADQRMYDNKRQIKGCNPR